MERMHVWVGRRTLLAVLLVVMLNAYPLVALVVELAEALDVMLVEALSGERLLDVTSDVGGQWAVSSAREPNERARGV